MNEKQLRKWIKQVQKRGDEQAANELISLFYPSIYAYVYKQTQQKELSMDLTQEIFIHMLQSIGGYEGKKASFKTWLYKIATYKVIDYFRSRQYRYDRSSESMAEMEVVEKVDFTVELEFKEDVEKVASLINEMEVRSQDILRLKLFAEQTFAEIAATLGSSEATVKTKYYAAIRKIKTRMEGMQYGERKVRN
ncbi:RNA polymerase sigma factor [Bacillus sp. CHD6a]|uniref:RNA polymerase sigma factor n=1 Tax=Bacillus sp. CHD6a TaxID=1643452 RepID=UPI0006CCD22F|nr:RNA polymerase sigma factor [Bacillus sp. CHD6a]KPB05900.1 RNA polymerase sigma-70 factor [Bacillus sp. CHD6a]